MFNTGSEITSSIEWVKLKLEQYKMGLLGAEELGSGLIFEGERLMLLGKLKELERHKS